MSGRKEATLTENANASSLSEVTQPVAEVAQKHVAVLRAVATEASERIRRTAEDVTEQASKAIAALGSHVGQNRLGLVLIGVGLGVVIGGVALTYFNSQQGDDSRAANNNAASSDREQSTRQSRA